MPTWRERAFRRMAGAVLCIVTQGSVAAAASTASMASGASEASDASTATAVVPDALASSARGSMSPVPLLQAPDSNGADLAAVRRGAQTFLTYCVSCHGARFVMRNSLKPLGLLDTDGASATPNAPVQASMSPEDARAAFGRTPPDLSLIAASRGRAWIYTYLRSFYDDPAQASGTNNLLEPGVAMPNVLAGLQGRRVLRVMDPSSAGPRHSSPTFVQTVAGTRTGAEFDADMADLVAFLDWTADPSVTPRHRWRLPVLGFLIIFVFVAWRLQKSYWKNR